MRRVFVVAALGLLACTGTVSLGTVPSGVSVSDAGSTSATDAATCTAAPTVVNDFEQGIVGTDPNTGGIYGSVSVDHTNPITGTGSLKVAGAAYAYLDFYDQPFVCRMSVSFKLRPSAELIANGATLVELSVASTSLILGGGRAPLVIVNPGGSLSIVQVTFPITGPDDDGGAPTVLARTETIGQLVAGQVSEISFAADESTRSLTLTVDDHTTSTTFNLDPNITGLDLAGLDVGATQPFPATNVGTFWIDDLKIGAD